MSIREKGINDYLVKWIENRGRFLAVYAGVHLYNEHYFINQYSNNQSLLFANIYNVTDNIAVCPYMFLNNNRTFAKLDLEFGDVIEFDAYGELYRFGQRYHPLSTTRCTVNYYRLKYPKDVKKVGKAQISHPLKDIPVIDLRENIKYSSFEEYSLHTPFIKNPVDKELLICSLMDGVYADKIWLNKNRKVNCSNCKPYVIYEYVYNTLPLNERFELESFHLIPNDVIWTPPRPIADTNPATDDTIKHEEEDLGFIGFRFKKS